MNSNDTQSEMLLTSPTIKLAKNELRPTHVPPVDRPSLLQDRDDAKLLLGIASASRKALIGEYMTSHQIYDRAVSIAETQRLGCAKVLERINASNEILDKILKLIQESGLSEAFEDPIQCLNIKRGLHLSSSDLALPTPYQGFPVEAQNGVKQE